MFKGIFYNIHITCFAHQTTQSYIHHFLYNFESISSKSVRKFSFSWWTVSAVFKGTDSESYEEDISSLHYAATFLPVKLVNMYGPAADFHSDVRFLKLSLSAIFRNLCAKLFASKYSVRALYTVISWNFAKEFTSRSLIKVIIRFLIYLLLQVQK